MGEPRCTVGEWTATEACSSTCGEGTQLQTRTLTPKLDPADCQGVDEFLTNPCTSSVSCPTSFSQCNTLPCQAQAEGQVCGIGANSQNWARDWDTDYCQYYAYHDYYKYICEQQQYTMIWCPVTCCAANIESG